MPVCEAVIVGSLGEDTRGERAHLVAQDLPLGVVLEVAVSLEAVLDQLTEFLRERVMVEQVVDTKARARRLGGVRRTNTLLGCADARPAELDLLEAVYDLVEVEDEVCAIRDEQPPGAVESCCRGSA